MAARPDIAFEDLLREWRDTGFALSPTDYIEVTAIFNQFTGTREEFKYHMAPIICRNREEQAAFYRIYDAHTSLTGHLDRQYAQRWQDYAAARIPVEFANAFIRFASKQYYFWVLFALAISVIIRIVPLLHQKKHPIAAVHANVTDTVAKDSDLVAPSPSHHAHIFVAKAYKHLTADTPEVHSRTTPQGQPIEKVNTITSTTFGRLLVLGFAGLALSLSVFPLRRSNLLPNLELDKSPGDDAPIDIPFGPKDQLIQNLPILNRIARDLVQPMPTDVYQLDINSTIRESIKSYGLLTPIHANVHRRPEYLMLIDNSHPIRAHLFRYLAETLARLSVPLDYYYYPINHYLLNQRHGDGTIIDPTGNDIPEPLFAQFDFGPELAFATPEAARVYLHDEDLFQWLCALAIYPTLQWEVLLSIGAAVLKQRNALHKLNIGNLLRLTRIEWLNSGKTIPTDIRLQLLRQLGLREELTARQTILELLKESDALMSTNATQNAQIQLLAETQSFILYAFDTRANHHHEADARKFMTRWDRRQIPDLATVLYLQNKDRAWDTPVRSPDDPTKSVDTNRFINELLALRVIHNPRMRAFFRNLGYSFFFILALLWLFKDPIQPLKINSALNLIDHDYPTPSLPLTIRIPVNTSLKNILHGNRLLVTLNNYDNNRYSQRLTLHSKDTLTATFPDITMTGKPADSPTFQIILNNQLTIDAPYTSYYSTYLLDLPPPTPPASSSKDKSTPPPSQ